MEMPGGINSKDEAVEDRHGDAVALGAMALGFTTMVFATGAAAQQAASEDQTVLPPLEVTAAKKKAPAKKKVVQKKPQAAPVAAPVVSEAPDAEAPQDSTAAFTPATGNTLQSGTGLGRLQGSVQGTPQIVNVVTQERIEQQNLTTVDQALRAVPGVTVTVGEGNGGFNGDQFRIRGFDAKGDLYIDGLRDFGVYVRDSFAFEQVDVLKGPSSESFGMGTTGGAINLRQKTAHLGNSGSADITVGTDSLVRTTVDVNRQVDATTAARAVAMYHDQDIADRDNVYSNRWGFLGSVGFGLGTDTQLTLNYLHQENDRVPDYGVPFLRAPGTSVGLPATEFGIPRSNYYGKETDRDETKVDILTARLTTKVNPWLTVHNDSRLEFFDRTISTSPTPCAQATCNDVYFASGDAPYTFGAGGGSSYDQESWGLQNITTAVAKFNTGSLRHEAIAGLDVFYQQDERLALRYTASKIPGTLLNPDYSSANYSIVDNPLNQKKANATNVGLFASDRVWLTPEFSVLGGIRWDDYNANYSYTNTTTGVWNPEINSETRFWSPKVSVIWEPVQWQTYYASWATSASPPGQFVTSGVNPIGTGANQNELDPEENESYEVGAKYSLLGGRLGVSAALFQVDKSNAYYPNPIDGGDPIASGEEQRVRGVELGINGKLTEHWTVAAAYTYLDTEIQKSTTAGVVGNHIPGVPENAASFWTTYDVASLLAISGKLLVGGGITYAQEMFIRNDETNKVPDTFVIDGMISYEIDQYRFAVNGYNLTDELYYDSYFQGENAFSSRATPAPGRAVTFTAGIKF